MKWFYIDESIIDADRRIGPFTDDEMQDLAREGKVKEATLVWHSGEDSWKPWKEYAEAQAANEMDQDKILQDTINEILREQVLTKRYAGFFVRALACIIDYALLIAVGSVIVIIMGRMGFIDLQAVTQLADAYVKDPSSSEALNSLFNAPGMSFFVSIWSIMQAAYFIILHAIYGATLGKKVFHIHVETGAGEKVSWLVSAVRYVASLLTQFTLMFYGLGYLIVFIDPKRRTVHDFIANTRVVFNTPKVIKITEK